MSPLEHPAADPRHWLLDPEVVFLNHGSFGSCPRVVLEWQGALRSRMERQPVQFLVRDIESLWDHSRAVLAEFVGAAVDTLVFVPNATAGVNTVLRSLRFAPDDEVLVTNHEYNACRNALEFAAERNGARVVVAEIPFPLGSSAQIIDAVMGRVTSRTRLALLDHVTSQTGLVMPLEQLVPRLTERGIDTLVDGAHAPGMLALNLEKLGAAYYTGNCHKWICGPKGAGFLCVRSDRQRLIRPLIISHGANSPRRDRSRFLVEFGWTGTWDPSACLSVPEALRFVGSLSPDGWPGIMRRNRELALAGREILCEALEVAVPCPADLIGSLASVPIPDAASNQVSNSPLYADPLQDRLREKGGIEVPIIPWPEPPKRLLRISAQLYNSLPQYRLLAASLAEVRDK